MHRFILLIVLLVSLPSHGQLRLKIPAEYQELGFFFDGYATAKKNNKWGIIDENNTVVVAIEFQEVTLIYKNLFAVKNTDNSWQFIDSHGTLSQEKYEEIGYADAEMQTIKVKKNGLWGYLNFQLETIIPCSYQSLWHLRDDGTLVYSNGNGYGVIALNGDTILPDTFPSIKVFPDYYFAGTVTQSTFYNLDGNRVDDSTYFFLTSVAGAYIVSSYDGRDFFVLDEELAMVHNTFQRYDHVSNNLFIVQTENGEMGLYDIRKDTWIFKTKFATVSPESEYRIHIDHFLDQRHEIVDTSGTKIIEVDSHTASFFAHDDHIMIESYEKYGFYSEHTGKLRFFDCEYIDVDGNYFAVIYPEHVAVYNHNCELVADQIPGDGHPWVLHDGNVTFKGPNGMCGVFQIIE